MTWEDEVRELIDRRQERKKVVEATEREVKELDVEISTLMIMHDLGEIRAPGVGGQSAAGTDS
jgi:hypothetical protein